MKPNIMTIVTGVVIGGSLAWYVANPSHQVSSTLSSSSPKPLTSRSAPAKKKTAVERTKQSQKQMHKAPSSSQRVISSATSTSSHSKAGTRPSSNPSHQPTSPSTNISPSQGTQSVSSYSLASWAPPGGYTEFVLQLPSAYHWVAEVSPYRPVGEVWYALGHPRTQVAVSLNNATVNAFAFPTRTAFQTTGDSGARIWLRDIAQGQEVQGTELISLGTAQFGWLNPLGNTGDKTLLLNVTLPNTQQNWIWAENVLAKWNLSDINTHATWIGNQPPHHRWLPQWPANPLLNSNAPSMPLSLRTVTWNTQP